MAVLSTRTITNTSSVTDAPPSPPQGVISDETKTFQFVAGWLLLIILLVLAARTRIGYVAEYYGLLLMILFILLTEYSQIVPLLNAVSSVGEFNNG